MKCKICGKQFEKEISLKRHITVMYGRLGAPHVPWLFYQYKYNGRSEYSKKNLYNLYVNKKMSTPMISSQLKLNKGTLLNLMHFYNIPMRSISDAAKNQIDRDGIWNKDLDKYSHPSIMKYSKDRLGKNNPFFKPEGFKERKQKLIEVGKKARKNSNIGTRSPKTTEVRMCKILDFHKISYVRNFALKYKDGDFIKWRLYDFWINDAILLEMHGDYWHANPKKYKTNQKVNIRGHKIAKDVWNNDAFKNKLAKDNGYDLKVIWESDFKQMTDIEVISLLKSYGLKI